MPTVTTAEETRPGVADAVLATPSGRLARTVGSPRTAFLGPALLMLVLGLVGLDRHSVWRDEAASLVAARRSLGDLAAMLDRVEAVHAVYYTFLHVWLQLGSGEVWARVPSVLAMAVAAGLVGSVGARLVSARTGLVAGVLFAVNPSVSFYAQEARSTALVTACALGATLLLLEATTRGRRWWVAYAAACTLLAGLNLLAVLVPATHGMTLLLGRRPRALRAWGLAVLPAVGVATLVGLATLRGPNQTGWIPRPGLDSLRSLAFLVAGPSPALVAVVGVLVAAGTLPLADRQARRLQSLAVPLLLVPPVALLAVSFVLPAFVPRYVFPSVAAAALLAALGLERLAAGLAGLVRRLPTSGTARTRPSWVPAAAVVLVVLATAVAGLGPQRAERTAASRSDDLAAAAGVVASGALPGDAVLFLPDNRRLVAFVYPEAFAGVRDLGLADSPEQAGNLIGRNRPLDATLSDLRSSPRVWVLGRPGLEPTAAEADGRAELQALEQGFTTAQRTSVHGMDVVLFVRRSPAS